MENIGYLVCWYKAYILPRQGKLPCSASKKSQIRLMFSVFFKAIYLIFDERPVLEQVPDLTV